VTLLGGGLLKRGRIQRTRPWRREPKAIGGCKRILVRWMRGAGLARCAQPSRTMPSHAAVRMSNLPAGNDTFSAQYTLGHRTVACRRAPDPSSRQIPGYSSSNFLLPERSLSTQLLCWVKLMGLPVPIADSRGGRYGALYMMPIVVSIPRIAVTVRRLVLQFGRSFARVSSPVVWLLDSWSYPARKVASACGSFASRR
jgi:hypothetical protein